MLFDEIEKLTCVSPHAKAGKAFIKMPDGTIHKESYGAGSEFKHEQKSVSSLEEVAKVFEESMNDPYSFFIRGEPLPGIGQIVRRKSRGKEATFQEKGRYWVMIDIDKLALPDFMNPAANPDEVALWVKNGLPENFINASCWYKFSSSQNVTCTNTVSIHLVFWCNRPVTNKEWKRFFKLHPCGVDLMLYTPVQPHYTASPIFNGMSDPLKKRSGFLKGESDIVIIPELPEPEYTKPIIERHVVGEIGQSEQEAAVNMVLAYYPKEGKRERFCATIAAVLYRGGWAEEDIAEFILNLATLARDDEIMKRHDNTYRICAAIDDGRPVMGIPVLKEEFKVNDASIEEILSLLGIGKPDMDTAIKKLSSASSPNELNEVISLLLPLSVAEREIFLEQVANQTKIKKGTLNKILKDALKQSKGAESPDEALKLINLFLNEFYEDGRHLMRLKDGIYYRYNGKCWVSVADDLLKQQLLELAPQVSDSHISSLINAALNLLEGRVFHDGDPFRRMDMPPAVYNCLNGEAWFDENGKIIFKPHRPESYLTHCINANYDPMAVSPQFDSAMLEIFACNNEPQEMFHHLMEVIGYICQPWRKIPIIPMMYGTGRNGKTASTNIIESLLGTASIMSCRIDSVENSPFKIGALADKLALIDDDIAAGTLMPDGFLKKISEEKILTGEHKHRDSFEFKCRAVPLMLGNDYPSLKDFSYGMQQRLMVIPFKRQFEPHEIKLGLFDKLWEEEASGILNHAIKGFQRVKQRNGFKEPLDCIQAKKDWLLKADALAGFIDSECAKGADKNQLMKVFYNNFKEYCKGSGIKHVLTQTNAKKRLENLGYEVKKLDGYDRVKGLSAPAISPSLSY